MVSLKNIEMYKVYEQMKYNDRQNFCPDPLTIEVWSVDDTIIVVSNSEKKIDNMNGALLMLWLKNGFLYL